MTQDNFDPFDPASLEEGSVEETLDTEETLELISSGTEDHLGFSADEIEQDENVEEVVEKTEEQEAVEVEETEDLDEVQRLRDEMDRMRSGLVGDLQEKRNRIRKLEQFIDARLNALAEKGQEEVEPEIDPDENPVGYLEDRINRGLDEVRTEIDRTRAEEYSRNAVRNATTSEAQFVSEHPDYYEKLNVLRATLYNGYVNQGLTQEDAVQAIQAWEGELMGHCYSTGKNPAETVYTMAQKIQGQEPTKVEEQKVVAKAPAESDKIARARSGVEKSKTLSNGSGGTNTGLALQDVLKLPESKRRAVLLDHDLSERLFSGGTISRMEIK